MAGPGRVDRDLVVSLGNAAVEVRTTEQRVVICPRCPEPVLAGSPEQHRTRWQESTQPPGIAPGAVAFGI